MAKQNDETFALDLHNRVTGEELEKLAVRGRCEGRLGCSLEDGDLACHLSGAETKVQQWIRKEELPAGDIAREIYDLLARTIVRLLKAGANINAQDRHGMTALMSAAKNPDPNVVKALMAGGANMYVKDQRGWTALMFAAAAERPNLGVVKAFLDAGADANAIGSGGVTPLMLAAAKNPDPDVVRVLLKSGADVYAKDTAGHDVLWYVQSSKREQGEKAQFLNILREGLSR